jgi:hypothetical protein
LNKIRPIEIVVGGSVFLLLGVISIVYGLDYILVQGIKGGFVGIVFGIIDFVAAWWIFDMRKRGGILGLVWAFVAILSEFILPLVFARFTESDSVEEIIVNSLAILVLIQAWPRLRTSGSS